MSPLTLVLFIIGLVALVVGAEVLVKGASRLAAAAGITPLVIGLTVVAFGTSAPELAVSVASAWKGQAEIAMGNVVGSNIFNVLLILGLSALVTPLVVSQQLVRLDVPLMIAASVLVLLLGLDNAIGRFDGIILFALIVTYTVFLVRKSRAETRAAAALEGAEEPPPTGARAILVSLAQLVAGIALLVLGSRWLVNGAVEIAVTLGISEAVVGLTIVAAGTSLPEVATSVMASIRGERDIAVGNAVGSNLFNLLSVLGLSSIVAPNGIAVPPELLGFDLPVMIAVAVACLPIFFTDHLIARWEGALFLFYFVAYVTFLVGASVGHAALPLYSQVMTLFVIPLTAVTLVLLSVRAWRRRHPA